MVQTAAKIFGVVFLLIGILGFIPAFTPDGHLLGIFHVNALHNVIHIGSGLAALWAGFGTYRASQLYFQVFGIVYAIVAALGLVYMEGAILGLVANNMADTLLHIAIAASALYLGFAAPRDTAITQ
jgi:hypothetical protein